MSNLEHLIENGLCRLKETENYGEWNKQMYEDPNWKPYIGITIDDLWVVCQYVQYTWIPELYDEINELKGKVYGGKECLKQSE